MCNSAREGACRGPALRRAQEQQRSCRARAAGRPLQLAYTAAAVCSFSTGRATGDCNRLGRGERRDGFRATRDGLDHGRVEDLVHPHRVDLGRNHKIFTAPTAALLYFFSILVRDVLHSHTHLEIQNARWRCVGRPWAVAQYIMRHAQTRTHLPRQILHHQSAVP